MQDIKQEVSKHIFFKNAGYSTICNQYPNIYYLQVKHIHIINGAQVEGKMHQSGLPKSTAQEERKILNTVQKWPMVGSKSVSNIIMRAFCVTTTIVGLFSTLDSWVSG